MGQTAAVWNGMTTNWAGTSGRRRWRRGKRQLDPDNWRVGGRELTRSWQKKTHHIDNRENKIQVNTVKTGSARSAGRNKFNQWWEKCHCRFLSFCVCRRVAMVIISEATDVSSGSMQMMYLLSQTWSGYQSMSRGSQIILSSYRKQHWPLHLFRCLS